MTSDAMLCDVAVLPLCLLEWSNTSGIYLYTPSVLFQSRYLQTYHYSAKVEQIVHLLCMFRSTSYHDLPDKIIYSTHEDQNQIAPILQMTYLDVLFKIKNRASAKKKLLWIAPKMNKFANEKMHFNKIFCKMTAIPFRPQYVKLQFVSGHVWQFNAGCRCAVVQYITYNTRKQALYVIISNSYVQGDQWNWINAAARLARRNINYHTLIKIEIEICVEISNMKGALTVK